MTSSDILWLSLRWLHILAAAGWFGSTLFYAIVVSPGFKSKISTNKQPEQTNSIENLEKNIIGEWREFLEITAFILIISGAVLAFNRLGQPNIGSIYVIILGVKVALTTYMSFTLLKKAAFLIKNTGSKNWSYSYINFVVGLGALVILIAVILRAIYDKSVVS